MMSFRLSNNGLLLAVLLVVFTGFAPQGMIARAEGFSVAKLMEKLDRTEREIVTAEVKSRIPSLFSDETDQKIASTMIAGFESLAEGKINDTIGTVLASTADIYDFKGILFERFPDGTYAGYFLRKADAYPEISKKLARGLLNKSTNWEALSKEVMSDYATQKYEAWLKEGQDLWRDAITQIINPPEILGKVGIDPIDLYLQSVDDWSTLVQRQRRDWNADMVDCAFRAYQKYGAEGYLSIDVAQADCDFLNSGSLLGRFTAFMGGKRTSTGAVAALGVSSDQFVALMRRFETTAGDIPAQGRPGFARWVGREFERVAAKSNRETAINFSASVESSAAQFESKLSATLKQVDGAYYQAMLDKLGQSRLTELVTGKPAKDGNSDGGLAGEDSGSSDEALKKARKYARKGCNPEKLRAAVKVLSDAGVDAALARKAKTRADTVAAAKGHRANALKKYKANKPKSALSDAKKATQVLRSIKGIDEMCPKVANRMDKTVSAIQSGLKNTRMVDQAIARCDIDRIDRLTESFEGFKNQSAVTKAALRKLDNAGLLLDSFDIEYAEVDRLAKSGKTKAARQRISGMVAEYRKAGMGDCEQVARLRDLASELKNRSAADKALARAASSCDRKAIRAIYGKAKQANDQRIMKAAERAWNKCKEKPAETAKKGLYEGLWVSVADYWGDSKPGNKAVGDFRQVRVAYSTPTSGRFVYAVDYDAGRKTWKGSWSMQPGSGRVKVRWDDGTVSTYSFLQLTKNFARLRTYSGSGDNRRPFIIEYRKKK